MAQVYYGDSSGSVAAGKLRGQSAIGFVPSFDELTMYGDAQEITGTASGGRDRLTAQGGDNATIAVYGDAWKISGQGAGGNDTITLDAGMGTHLAHGDADQLMDDAVGGRDVIVGAARLAQHALIGDATTIGGRASGGNDTITGHAIVTYIYGDAVSMRTEGRGGNDVISFATGIEAYAYGDAFSMGQGRGGNDTITGSEGGSNMLYGDAQLVGNIGDRVAQFTCGNDRLIAGLNAGNLMVGDAEGAMMSSVPPGSLGRDTLIVANGDEGVTRATLYGDLRSLGLDGTGAADRFVLRGTGAQAFIMDFRRAEGDRIDLRDYAGTGVHGLADLTLRTFSGSVFGVTEEVTGVQVWIDETTFVVLMGQHVTTARDFMFA